MYLYLQIVLFSFVYTGINSIYVRIYPSEAGILGPSDLHLICRYEPEDGDTVTKIHKQAKFNNNFTTIASFSSNRSDSNLTTAGRYPSSRVNLTTSPNTVSMTFKLIECEDETEYRCEVAVQSNDTFGLSTSVATRIVVKGINSIYIRIYPSEAGILGPSDLHLICTYEPEDGDTVTKINIQAKFNNNFTTIASFSTNRSDSNLTTAGRYLSSRVNLTTSSNTVSMTFSLIECEDETEYRCEIGVQSNDTFELSTSAATRIVVKGRPAVPDNIPTWVPSTGIEEGTNVTFTCTGKVGKPAGKFIWTKYIGSVPTEYSDAVTTAEIMPGTCTYNGTSSVTIQMTAEDNIAVIKCSIEQEVATRDMFRQSEPGNLVVYYRVRNLQINKSPNLPDFAEGAPDITLTCSSEGNPTPTYTWHKDTDVNTTLATGNTFRLQKNDVIVNNTGNYVCVAKNSFNGKDHEMTKTEHIQIDITTPSTPVKPTGIANKSTSTPDTLQDASRLDCTMTEKWSLVAVVVILSLIQFIELLALFFLCKKGRVVVQLWKEKVYEDTITKKSDSHFYTTMKSYSAGRKLKGQGHYEYTNDNSIPNDEGHYEINLADDSIPNDEGHYELNPTDSSILNDEEHYDM